MPGRYLRVLAVVLLVGALLPLAGATWEITETRFFPEFGYDGSEGVITGQAVDRNGNILSPSHCSRANDFINVVYDYDPDQLDVSMAYTERPYGWYYDDGIKINESETSFSLFANGVCGVNGEDNVTVDVSDRGHAFNGAYRVRFLGDFKSEYWEDEEERIFWNVSRVGQFGATFADDANLSYRLYDPNATIVKEGRMGTGWRSPVVRRDASYSADITLPRGAGRYILSVFALNNSVSMDRSYGGIAKTLWVRPTYLRGEGDITVPSRKCSRGSPPTCEKGTTIEVDFHEEYADASYVNVTVQGATGGRSPYETFNLEQWNETYWNGTVTIPTDFDTDTHGTTLSIVISAVHSFERDNTREKSRMMTSKTVEIDPFKILGGAGLPFVRKGNEIGITAVPVTPYTENPIAGDTFTAFGLRVVNRTGSPIYSRMYRAPFGGAYDSAEEAFIDRPRIPYNISSGIHTAHVNLTDIYGETKRKSFSFRVLEADASERPVVIVAAGDQDTQNITETYQDTGLKRENVLLRNIGDSEATVEMEFTGDLQSVAVPADAPEKTIPADQQRVFGTNITLDAPGIYSGGIMFNVTGPDISQYTMTVPVKVETPCYQFSGTFCVTDKTVQQEINEAGEYNLSFVVQNVADGGGQARISAEGAITEFMDIGTSGTDVLLPGGNATEVNLGYSVAINDAGFYAGNITMDLDPDIVLRAAIDAAISKGRLSIDTDASNLGIFVDGEDVPVSFNMENTGTRAIQTVDVSSSGELGITEQATIDLVPGNRTNQTFTGTASTENTDGSEEKTATITISPNTGRDREIEVSYVVYPDFSGDIGSLKNEVGSLQRQLANRSGEDAADIRDDLERINSKLEVASQDWENDRYADAKRKYDGAQSDVETVNEAISELGSADTNGPDSDDSGNPLGPFILPMVIILGLFAVAGAILYLSIVPEDEVR